MEIKKKLQTKTKFKKRNFNTNNELIGHSKGIYNAVATNIKKRSYSPSTTHFPSPFYFNIKVEGIKK